MPSLNVKPPVVQPDLFQDPDKWADAIARLFADPARTGGFLAEAEKAEKACPGDPRHSLHGGDRRPARSKARQGAALSQALRQALRGEQALFSPVGPRARGGKEADRRAGAARASRSHRIARCVGRLPRRLGAARLARRAARRRHGSREPDPRAPSRNEGGSPPGAPEESSADPIRRAAANASAARRSAGDAGPRARRGRNSNRLRLGPETASFRRDG